MFSFDKISVFRMRTIWYFFLDGYENNIGCCNQGKKYILNLRQQYANNYTCIVNMTWIIMLLHTEIFVVFKQDVYSVYAKYSTKVHFPPNCFAGRSWSYRICSHTRRCISINCVTSVITDACRGVWLGCNFVVGYIVFR